MSNNENGDSKPLCLSWTAIGIITTIIIALITAAWTIRGQQLTDRLESYEDLRNMQLPAVVSELQQASEQVRLDTQEREQLLALQSQYTDLTQTAEVQQTQIVEAQTKVAELEAALEKTLVESNIVGLTEGQATELISNTVTLGIETIWLSDVSANINNESVRIRIGQSVDIPYAGTNCTIRLMEIKREEFPTTAVLNFTCVL